MYVFASPNITLFHYIRLQQIAIDSRYDYTDFNVIKNQEKRSEPI